MEKEMTIREFCERFKNGEFNSPDRKTQCRAGWFDWFCRDSALADKTVSLGNAVCSIKDSERFDQDNTYVFFKNNCPCVGPLYDQFSICDIENGDVLYCCQHLKKGSHGCERAHWEIFSCEDFEVPQVSGSWHAVRAYFMNIKKD